MSQETLISLSFWHGLHFLGISQRNPSGCVICQRETCFAAITCVLTKLETPELPSRPLSLGCRFKVVHWEVHRAGSRVWSQREVGRVWGLSIWGGLLAAATLVVALKARKLRHGHVHPALLASPLTHKESCSFLTILLLWGHLLSGTLPERRA